MQKQKCRLLVPAAALFGLTGLIIFASATRGPHGSSTDPSDPTFKGSVSCAECHERFYKLWSKSHHGLAMQPFTAKLAAEKLTPQTDPIRIGDHTYKVDLASDRLHFTETDGRKQTTYPLVHAMGGKNTFFFLTPLARGRLQVAPLGYDLNRKQWYDTGKSMVRHVLENDEPLPWKDRLLTFNTSCYNCHVSQLATNYDPKEDAYETTWGEPGINCETCHGPASEHIRVCREAPPGRPPKDLKIILTGTFTTKQQNDACSICHAKAGPITKVYPPGEPFFDHYDLTTLEDQDFYPDGRDLGENFTLTTWRMSPCAKSGKLDCIDCHTSSGRYRFRDKNPNGACLPCHKERVENAIDHTRHKAGSKGSLCISCHMPMTAFGRMRRSDHSMRPPSPSATLAFKSPNACTICHQKEGPAWADKLVREWRKRDYQAEILAQGHLVKAARDEKWEDLPAMLSYINRKDRDEVVATSLLRLLFNCSDPAKWPTVEGALQDPSPLVRSAAAAGLDNSPRPESREALLKALDDKRRLVRIRAAGALASLPRNQLSARDRARLEAASSELEASLQVRLDSWSAHYNLGNYYVARGRLLKGVNAFRTSARLRPDVVQPLVNLSMAYARLGKNELAEECLHQAVKVDPESAAVRFNLGLLLAEKQDLQGAQVHLRAALKADPDMAQAAYNLGVLLVRSGKTEGLAFLTRAARLQPGVPRYGYSLAFFLHQSGRHQDAEETLEALLGQHPAHAEAILLQAEILISLDKKVEAESLLKKAAERRDLSPAAQQELQKRLQSLSAGTSEKK